LSLFYFGVFMNISVYIPLTYNNMSRIVDIVETYDNGTVKPDELVINVFGVTEQKHIDILKSVYDLNLNYVKIFVQKTIGSDADNLNFAKTLTHKEIISYHNPNTIPSQFRIEYIKNYFENNDIFVLNHVLGYNKDIQYIPQYDKALSEHLYKRYFPFGVLNHSWNYTRTYGGEFGIKNIDYSSVSIRREVFDDVSWKNDYEYDLYKGNGVGLYYEFHIETLYKYKKSNIVGLELTFIEN